MMLDMLEQVFREVCEELDVQWHPQQGWSQSRT